MEPAAPRDAEATRTALEFADLIGAGPMRRYAMATGREFDVVALLRPLVQSYGHTSRHLIAELYPDAVAGFAFITDARRSICEYNERIKCALPSDAPSCLYARARPDIYASTTLRALAPYADRDSAELKEALDLADRYDETCDRLLPILVETLKSPRYTIGDLPRRYCVREPEPILRATPGISKPMSMLPYDAACTGKSV